MRILEQSTNADSGDSATQTTDSPPDETSADTGSNTPATQTSGSSQSDTAPDTASGSSEDQNSESSQTATTANNSISLLELSRTSSTQVSIVSQEQAADVDYLKKLIVQRMDNINQEALKEVDISELSLSNDFAAADFGQALSAGQVFDLSSLTDIVQLDLQQWSDPINIGPITPLEIETREVKVTDVYYERETLDFEAQGAIKLDNGVEVAFELSQHYDREYMELNSQIVEVPVLKDPLVVNMGSGAISFNDKQYEFDIDADGEMDNLYELGANAAYLAIDRNNNGTIDDGTELLGAISGDAFAELASYDDNQDGVINSQDEIFDSLVLWRYSDDQESITKVADSNINTFALASADTAFTFTNDQNDPLAVMRKSGVYANNDGTVGSLHQVDLVV